jgi:hypothetical protein
MRPHLERDRQDGRFLKRVIGGWGRCKNLQPPPGIDPVVRMNEALKPSSLTENTNQDTTKGGEAEAATMHRQRWIWK